MSPSSFCAVSVRALRRICLRNFSAEGRHFPDATYLTIPPVTVCRGSSCSDDGAPWLDLRLYGLAFGLVLVAAGRRDSLHCDAFPQVSRKEPIRLMPKDLEPLLEPSQDNPIPVSLPPPMPGLDAHHWARKRIVAPVLGMPMCGKAYLAYELKRYIEFFHGAHATVFDIKNYLGPGGDDRLKRDLTAFFNTEDSEWAYHTPRHAFLEKYGQDTLESGGGLAILVPSDTIACTSSKWSAHTKHNRRAMAKILQKDLQAQVCFIQVSVEDDAEGLGYQQSLGLARGKSPKEVQNAIEEYNEHYVPIQTDGSESMTPHIQMINYNDLMIVNRMMQSFVGSRICQFLSSFHPYQHTSFLSRHGESQYNVEGRLGGDSSLSPRGHEYARRLGEFTKYVVSGHCTNLVCVSLQSKEVRSLRNYLTKLPKVAPEGPAGLFAKGSWHGYGDSSGADVKDGMRLVRLQPGFGAEFVDAPMTVQGVMDFIGDGPATLVFVEGDVSRAGQVPARLWTSSLNRTIESAAFIPHTIVLGPDGKPWQQMARRTFRGLDEVYAGEYDGAREKEIPKEISADRKRDKLGFRYPKGESYYDIIARLDDVMTNLERIREPILIISHQAVLRLILGWLREVSREDSLDITIPQHCVVQICFDGLGEPRSYREYKLGPAKLADDGQANL